MKTKKTMSGNAIKLSKNVLDTLNVVVGENKRGIAARVREYNAKYGTNVNHQNIYKMFKDNQNPSLRAVSDAFGIYGYEVTISIEKIAENSTNGS